MQGVSVAGQRVWVAATLLLVSVGGEYCHSWLDSRAQRRDGFHCPERTDRREAVLCCGHCDLRYCCGDSRARLDQGGCTDHSRGQETPSSDQTADLPVYAPFLIVVCVFLVFVLLGSLVATFFCLSQKPLPPARSSQSPAPRDTLHSPSEALETQPMTASTGTSCGSSSSLCPLKSAPQGQTGHPQHRLDTHQQLAPPPRFPQTPNPAFHRTMTLPTMLHPLMFPTTMLNSYMMPMQGPRPYRSVPSPCPPNIGTSTVGMSSEVIL